MWFETPNTPDARISPLLVTPALPPPDWTPFCFNPERLSGLRPKLVR